MSPKTYVRSKNEKKILICQPNHDIFQAIRGGKILHGHANVSCLHQHPSSPLPQLYNNTPTLLFP